MGTTPIANALKKRASIFTWSSPLIRRDFKTCSTHGPSHPVTENKILIVWIPVWLQAAFWGLVAGSALLIGAALGYFARIPQRLIAGIMAFGSGVLISALSFDLMDQAYKRGGFDSTAIGFVGGAAMYTAANLYLARRGAKHSKRSKIAVALTQPTK